ncbi:MAG: hypothetical protein ACI4TK_00065 [Agathobacter sp.]
MTMIERNEKIKELKKLLAECNDFIQNTKTEWDEELEECKKDYEEACADLAEAELEYERELKRAANEGYNEAQMKTLRSLQEEGITLCKKAKEQAEEFLRKAQEDVERYPELLEQAKADKEKLEIQLMQLQKNTNSPLKWLINIVIWVIIIAVIFKACGK